MSKKRIIAGAVVAWIAFLQAECPLEEKPYEVPIGLPLLALYLLSQSRPLQRCATDNTTIASAADRVVRQQVVFTSASGALSNVTTPFPMRGNFCESANTLVTFNMEMVEFSATSRKQRINETGTFTFNATTTVTPLPADVRVRIE